MYNIVDISSQKTKIRSFLISNWRTDLIIGHLKLVNLIFLSCNQKADCGLSKRPFYERFSLHGKIKLDKLYSKTEDLKERKKCISAYCT